jgi:hypothetical protein
VGVFAEWQPAYAEAGISTFPVDAERKKPCVGNYLKGRLPASAQWARKFPEVNALGFACGKRNGLTVLDVDTTNDNVLADAFAKLGESPVVIGTASGKFHAYYHWNGEGRSVRKAALALGLAGPVDILGNGYALAPPSRGSKGEYRWLQGSLADLANLPVLRLPAPDPANDSALNNFQQIKGGPPTGSEPVKEGERNATLLRACAQAAPSCRSLTALTEFAHALNQSGQWAALPRDEVERTAASAWKWQIEGSNGFAGDQYVKLTFDELGVLETSPDGHYLFAYLKRQHWGREFVIANEMRNHLPCGSWSLPRFQAARKFLLDNQLIQQLRPAQKRVGPALFQFRRSFVRPVGEQGRGV